VANKKLRIGILMGGVSLEREVSFSSGRTVCDHIDTNIFEATPIFQTINGALYILPWRFLHRGRTSDFEHRLEKEAELISWDELLKHIDFCFLAIHGRMAEDGSVQGMLEILNIPYSGSKVFGSAIGMDKIVQKEWLSNNGVLVAKGTSIKSKQIYSISESYIKTLINLNNLSFPLVVKPSGEGSSLGIDIVNSIKELLPAIKTAAYIDSKVVHDIVIEEVVEGMEFSAICIEEKTGCWKNLSVTEIVKEKSQKIYDYTQKYMPGRASKITPARCSENSLNNIARLSEKVSSVLNFNTSSRIDGFLKSDGSIVIIDPNTISGMGPSSFIFDQATQAGLNHTKLISHMIETELFRAGLENKINKTKDFKNMKNRMKIAIIFGGNTTEKEVSLDSGRNVVYKLSEEKYEKIPLFVDSKMELYKINSKLLVKNSTTDLAQGLSPSLKIKWSDLPGICDFVFIGLHGGKGEDGSIQGALETLGLPYNGSRIFSSALCMNKLNTSKLLQANGLNVPVSKIIFSEKDSYSFEPLKLPVVIKPIDEGCSTLVAKAKDEKEFEFQLKSFFSKTNKPALIEEFIPGVELTCGVVGNNNPKALVPSKSLAKGEILSVEEKFLPGAGENQTPAPLSDNAIKLVQKTVEAAHKIANCRGYARIDCFYQNSEISPTKKERVVVLEINTLPALTPATCLFHQAAEAGITASDFLDKIIILGLEEHAMLKINKDEMEQKKTVLNNRIECN
jgi:D-alanine--D-alanine ligase